MVVSRSIALLELFLILLDYLSAISQSYVSLSSPLGSLITWILCLALCLWSDDIQIEDWESFKDVIEHSVSFQKLLK
jgi:hypothetical protein